MLMPLVLTNRRRRGGSASAPAFSPSSLYSSGSQGIWLDPSDLTTMFSDRAGTTPVTTPGTTVGLRLDKSKGLVLGAELVTNGDFASSANWTLTTWTISGGKLNGSASGGGGAAQSGVITAGKWYKVTMDVVCITGAQLRIGPSFGAMALFNVTNGVSATITGYFLANGQPFSVEASGAVFNGTIDNISVRELAGNHAVAPTDAARPIYGVEPKGGRRNLLLATDTLATQSLTVTAVAHTLAFTGTGTVTLSGASIAGPLIGTGAANRVSLTFTPTAASLTLTVVGSVTLGQLELGSSATAYQKVVTAYNVTESGVATCHYVQYDGSDDSLSTSAIDFTGTDKMSVFAGVRKLSDATAGILVELSVSSTSNNGCFYLAAPETTAPSGNYSFKSRGTVNAPPAQTSTFSAPISNVVSGIADISADIMLARVNGVQSGSTATDQGTGNYGNYALFIGRRNNATLPFSGKDYGIVIVGKAASAGEITDTETWLAARTSGVSI